MKVLNVRLTLMTVFPVHVTIQELALMASTHTAVFVWLGTLDLTVELILMTAVLIPVRI